MQVSGDPKKKFALPIGWVKFPHRHQRQQQAAAADNVAPHAAHRAAANHGRGRARAAAGEDDSDILLLHFSPTINYAGLERFSPGKRFTDKRQQRGHVARVALQVAVGPGSYKAGETQVTTAETRTIGHHIHKSNVYCLL